MTDVTKEARRPAAQYLFNPGGEKPEPLDPELLAWLVDQLCSDTRVHPERTMSIGFITNQAVYELPAIYDALTTASAEAEGLKARIVELEGALGQIAGTDLFEVTGYHTRTWSIPETGNEYESKDPIFKRSSFRNAQDFQAIARQALAGGTDHG